MAVPRQSCGYDLRTVTMAVPRQSCADVSRWEAAAKIGVISALRR